MQEISETLNIDGQVVNVHVEIEKLEPESIAAPVAVQDREANKLTKFSTPAAKPNPGPKPSTDAAVNGKTGVSFGDWVAQDLAYKESQPLPISDGGKGVSH